MFQTFSDVSLRYIIYQLLKSLKFMHSGQVGRSFGGPRRCDVVGSRRRV